MCDHQRLRPSCAYAQSDQSLCLSLEYSMTVKLLTGRHLEFLSLKGGCTGSHEATLFKMPHCWTSHVAAQLFFSLYLLRDKLNINISFSKNVHSNSSHAGWFISQLLCHLLIRLFEKNNRGESNRLGPDQVRRFVAPYLGTKCFQKIISNGTFR